VQRRKQVFKKSRDEIKTPCHTRCAMDAGICGSTETKWSFNTRLRALLPAPKEIYAREVCDAVINVWQPTPGNKVIINLADG
jgi:2-isopropylmalate synthase